MAVAQSQVQPIPHTVFRGIVVVDSLNEVELQGHESETRQFVKEVRADVCDRRNVPIFTSVTTNESETLSIQNESLFDGIVEMRRNESAIDGVRLKQLSIRKMDGVLAHPDWVTYENTGDGFRIFDPGVDLTTVYGTISSAAGQQMGGHSASRPHRPRQHVRQ